MIYDTAAAVSLSAISMTVIIVMKEESVLSDFTGIVQDPQNLSLDFIVNKQADFKSGLTI